MSCLAKKIVLSGAVSGHEGEAEEYFKHARKIVEERFPLAQVFNPTDLPKGLKQSQYMAVCMTRIRGWATTIVYIRNDYYEASAGSRLERKWAQEKGLEEFVLRGYILSELPKGG